VKKLLNVLYVTASDAYLALEGENIVIKNKEQITMRLPLHNLENIVCFNYLGASPALLGACAERQIGLCFLSPSGRFLARIEGSVKGNVLLRKKQYALSEDKKESIKIARSMLIGKISNCRKVIERAVRDHGAVLNVERIRKVSGMIKGQMVAVSTGRTIEDLSGFEGSAAKAYFEVLDDLILQQKEDFYFKERSRRPPLDNFNALLSFLYTLLTHEVSSALETVGLDPYVGFLHQDRPGRPSLALDLMEELRPVFADRMAISLVNRRQITGKGFEKKESGGILMDNETRKKVIKEWQDRKKEQVIHPFLKEKINFGLLPYAQALLLSRYLRGDLDAYPPFFWS